MPSAPPFVSPSPRPKTKLERQGHPRKHDKGQEVS